MMKRWHKILLKFTFLLILYLAVLLYVPPQYKFMAYCLPLHLLIGFGCYSLCRIGYNLMTLSNPSFCLHQALIIH